MKDLTAGEMEGADALRRFSYRPVESDPNMVLELAPAWRSYEDYLAGLTGKYRNAARKIGKDLAQAGCTLGPLKELSVHAERLHALYLCVVDNAAVLRQYAWKMRLALTLNGEPKPPKIYLMRYDIDGKLQKTPTTVEKSKKYVGLRGKKAKKK